jgi:hypothetical protein
MNINGVKYDAFNEGEFHGQTTWMVRRYEAGADQGYVECLFSADTKDPHEAVEIAIKNNSWS